MILIAMSRAQFGSFWLRGVWRWLRRRIVCWIAGEGNRVGAGSDDALPFTLVLNMLISHVIYSAHHQWCFVQEWYISHVIYSAYRPQGPQSLPPPLPTGLPSVLVRARPGGDDVLERPAPGDHGQHVLDVRDHHVQKVRPRRVEHLLDRSSQFALLHDALGRHAAGLRHLDEVGEDVHLIARLVELRVPAPQVGVRAVGLVEAVLPLHDHAQVLVVEDHDLHVELVHVDRRQLLAVHHEAPVSVDVNYHRLGPPVLAVVRRGRAQRGREPEAHGPEPP
mmetsp:Transcript_25362/g.80246  ORF Transcript_25362/g.80246 Transcript_25362/m.80246 type:complete len:278 (+) Transcript_25362:1093-1926(+)